MLLHLIKKEFVVIQKQTLWMIGLVILIPLLYFGGSHSMPIIWVLSFL